MELLPIDKDGRISVFADDPSGSLPAVLEQTSALYARRGFLIPWIVYVAVEDGRCVGSCGFAGVPAGNEVEIAYFTFPGLEGQGIASRMAALLITATRAAALEQGLTYIAHTLPQEGPSTSVLRRLGFEPCGSMMHPEDGPVWKWRRAKAL